MMVLEQKIILFALLGCLCMCTTKLLKCISRSAILTYSSRSVYDKGKEQSPCCWNLFFNNFFHVSIQPLTSNKSLNCSLQLLPFSVCWDNNQLLIYFVSKSHFLVSTLNNFFLNTKLHTLLLSSFLFPFCFSAS